jgi:hypothetical protein
LLIVVAIFSAGCEKIGKKIENYDLFGLEQAQEGIQQQDEKIKAARDYQKNFSPQGTAAQNEPNILGNY